MKRHIAVAVALVAVAWAFFGQAYTPWAKNDVNADPKPLLPTFSIPSLTAPGIGNASAQVLAWNTWENYVEFAKNHDFEGLKSVSHQTSVACNDPAREAQCFALMDSVVAIAGEFSMDEFKHVKSDAKQIILHTDGEVKKILYFTRNPDGTPKVLGLKVCLEDESSPEETCEMLNVDTKDDDGDGWWNSIEAIFYK